MARRKTNDLENQMSLMDMMASESPEYTEEGPEELLDPGEDMGDSEGQTDKPFKLVANKTTKAKVSISTQALNVVKAVYADTVETNWEELFDGFDRLYAITFSSGIEFVNKVINKFSYAEVVFGCEKIIANDIAAIMSVQIDSVQRLAKSKSAGNLANRLDDGSLQLYVSRDTKSHEKIFILESADHKRVRVITGSANMSASAFCGIQRENIVCFDDEAAFSHYKVLFETFKETCSDNVSYKAVVNTMNQEDYLKENIKEVPVFQAIEKQKLVFLEQAQPEDEVEYEIVADVKKMQELVKPRNTSRISSTLRLVSLQISSRHAESICRTMCVSCTITTIWVMRALVVLQLRKSNWHGRLTRASSGLIRSRTGSFTPIRRMDRGTN